MITAPLRSRRILEVVKSATAVGTVPIKRSTDSELLCHMPPGVKQAAPLLLQCPPTSAAAALETITKGLPVQHERHERRAQLDLQNEHRRRRRCGPPAGRGQCRQRYGHEHQPPDGSFRNHRSRLRRRPDFDSWHGPCAGATIGIWLNLTLTAGLAADATTYSPKQTAARPRATGPSTRCRSRRVWKPPASASKPITRQLSEFLPRCVAFGADQHAARARRRKE